MVVHLLFAMHPSTTASRLMFAYMRASGGQIFATMADSNGL